MVLSSLVMAQPKLSFSESKQILVLDEESENSNTVSFKANFTNAGTKKLGSVWSISGTKDKDWEFVKGNEKTEQITVEFNKVGIYSVSLSVSYSTSKILKDGSKEEQEDELSVEKENLITVTNNLDELTQIHADSSFIKLVKKASDYVVKPKYANDPTPHIFLAKGYFGMYRKDLKQSVAKVKDGTFEFSNQSKVDFLVNEIEGYIEAADKIMYYWGAPLEKLYKEDFNG